MSRVASFNQFLRNGARFAPFPQHPVQTSSTDQHKDEETNTGRILPTDSAVPYYNLLGNDTRINTFSSLIGHIRNPSADVTAEGGLCKLISNGAATSTFNFFPKGPKKTAEVSVQTNLYGIESELQFAPGRKDSRSQEDQKKWRDWNAIGEQLMSLDQEAEAVQYFRVAAQHGDVAAMFNFATCLYEGDCVEQNYSEAFNWFQRSADLGHKDAMYHLGCCLNKGTGTNKNSQLGLDWINKSAHAGQMDAAFFMITHHMYDRKPNLARVFIAPTACDPEYEREMKSWVADRCVSDECCDVLREELAI